MVHSQINFLMHQAMVYVVMCKELQISVTVHKQICLLVSKQQFISEFVYLCNMHRQICLQVQQAMLLSELAMVHKWISCAKKQQVNLFTCETCNGSYTILYTVHVQQATF